MRVYTHIFTCSMIILSMSMTFEHLVRADVKDSEESTDFNADELINTLRGAMGTLFDYVGDENGCFHKCPNDAKPLPKKGHVPVSNGCGSFGIKMDTSQIPGVGECCNKHDMCYDTCNRQKEKCDNEFRNCLTNICKALKKHVGVSKDVYKGCTSTADIMYAGTMALGCKPYKDSQRNACTCPVNRTEF